MRQSLFGIHHPTHKFCLLAADLWLIAVCFSIATKIRLGLYPDFVSVEFFGLTSVIVSCLFIGSGYTSIQIASRPKLPLNTFFVVLASTIPCTFLIYFSGPERFTELFGRGIFPFAILLFGASSALTRVILNKMFLVSGKSRELLVLGEIKERKRFHAALNSRLIGYNIKLVPTFTQNCLSDNFDAIVITPDYHPSTKEQKLLVQSRLNGVPIFSLSDFFENFLFLIPVNEINSDWFIRAEGFTMLHSSVASRVKRCVDIVGALLLMILSLPFALIAMLLIKLVSRGPVLFSQVRVGMHGQPFTIYKFRTMRLGAEKNGAQWASSDDSRIIPFGKFFRTSRIDELPQCWNILRGEMSIIGPRPERPEFTSLLAEDIPYYDLRHVVKPGLTGWAQVSYPYGASTEDALRKLQYDLYYIKNYSLILDLNILLRTVLVTLRRGGR